MIGTGWRKTREESSKPIFWDGENQGGKWLMKYRRDVANNLVYTGPNEKEVSDKCILFLSQENNLATSFLSIFRKDS